MLRLSSRLFNSVNICERSVATTVLRRMNSRQSLHVTGRRFAASTQDSTSRGWRYSGSANKHQSWWRWSSWKTFNNFDIRRVVVSAVAVATASTAASELYLQPSEIARSGDRPRDFDFVGYKWRPLTMASDDFGRQYVEFGDATIADDDEAAWAVTLRSQFDPTFAATISSASTAEVFDLLMKLYEKEIAQMDGGSLKLLSRSESEIVVEMFLPATKEEQAEHNIQRIIFNGDGMYGFFFSSRMPELSDAQRSKVVEGLKALPIKQQFTDREDDDGKQ